MHKTRKLCAIMLDTVGRELLIDSEAKLDEQGWPRHEQKVSVKRGDKVLNCLPHFTLFCEMLLQCWTTWCNPCQHAETKSAVQGLMHGNMHSQLEILFYNWTGVKLRTMAHGLSFDGSYMHLQITFTTKKRDGSNGTDKVLAVSYTQFPAMCVKGDTIFLGKYLVTGSEDSSLYLTVYFAALPRSVRSAREFETTVPKTDLEYWM